MVGFSKNYLPDFQVAFLALCLHMVVVVGGVVGEGGKEGRVLSGVPL